jgi:phosphate-selective porin
VSFGVIKKKKNLRFTRMKMRIQHIFYGTVLMVVLTACSKGGTTTDDGSSGGGQHVVTPADVTAPVIDITTPGINQVFTSGSVISITGRLTDDYGLYRGTIKITNDANAAVVKEQAYEIHGLKLYDYSLTYSTAVTIPSDYTITVAFEDHGLNMTTKTVKVKVNP